MLIYKTGFQFLYAYLFFAAAANVQGKMQEEMGGQFCCREDFGDQGNRGGLDRSGKNYSRAIGIKGFYGKEISPIVR